MCQILNWNSVNFLLISVYYTSYIRLISLISRYPVYRFPARYTPCIRVFPALYSNQFSATSLTIFFLFFFIFSWPIVISWLPNLAVKASGRIHSQFKSMTLRFSEYLLNFSSNTEKIQWYYINWYSGKFHWISDCHRFKFSVANRDTSRCRAERGNKTVVWR